MARKACNGMRHASCQLCHGKKHASWSLQGLLLGPAGDGQQQGGGEESGGLVWFFCFWSLLLQDRQELEPTQDPEAQSQGHVLSELQKRPLAFFGPRFQMCLCFVCYSFCFSRSSEHTVFLFFREKSRPLHEYSIFNLMTYFLYSPLWLAGPTTTFNSFMSHLHDRPHGCAVNTHARFPFHPTARPQQAMSAWQLLLACSTTG